MRLSRPLLTSSRFLLKTSALSEVSTIRARLKFYKQNMKACNDWLGIATTIDFHATEKNEGCAYDSEVLLQEKLHREMLVCPLTDPVFRVSKSRKEETKQEENPGEQL